MKIKIRRRCKCGCGGITNPGNKYINAHNLFGNTHRLRYKTSEDTKRKISLAMRNLPEKMKRKISLGLIGNTHALGYRHIEKAKKKISLARKETKLSKEHKKNIGLALLEQWQDPEYQKMQAKARDIKPNKPEIKLGKILNKLYPNKYKYVGDFQFFLGGKNPDFMNVNGQKKLIELYGDYWHKKKSEQIRIDHFKKYGFNTLVIWEHELKESRLNLRRELIDFHKE